MSTPFIKDILNRRPDQAIEEVIKVDQDSAEIIRGEFDEYVMTDSIRDHFLNVLERYQETPVNPHEGIGVWISGFFGSGKSSFAKLLGLALANRDILGTGAAELLSQRRPDSRKLGVILRQIAEKIPTDAVIFDVSTDRGIRHGNQSMTEIMHRCFLRALGYAESIDIAQLEIDLEEAGELAAFKEKYRAVFDGKDWDVEKAKVAIALSRASRVMHEIEADTYPFADSWVKAAQGKADITPSKLAERARDLMARRRAGRNLVFVVDEVGQFVARDVQKMLDLQALVQSLGRVGRGKMWLIVTSQEKLTELVGGLDDKRVELPRLKDRFPLQINLEPSDISEVTSSRILAKNATGEKLLRAEFEKSRSRLATCTTVTASLRLPELTAESFIKLYPLLPYQVDLIIDVVSGLRTQTGASRHVGGANRTIIKLAQQLLIHKDVGLADKNIGALVRLDHIYDLVSGNISSELRNKISGIQGKMKHPYAAKVSKVICLLQFVQTVHKTPENIAACLHDGIAADSCLAEVKQALAELEKAKQVRLGDDGYRIPTPAEDDWEKTRDAVLPKPADTNEILLEIALKLWTPAPVHTFAGVKQFRAGLLLNDRLVAEGDVPFHVLLGESDAEFSQAKQELRARSQAETKQVFWAVRLTDTIKTHCNEYFRSKQILAVKERGARTTAEVNLVSEEKRRQGRHADELRHHLRAAFLSGSIFSRGNDRSPTDSATEVTRVAADTLGKVVPVIFDRYEEAAARVTKADLDAVMTAANLNGLPPVFTKLGLLRTEGNQTLFNADINPLREVLERIQTRVSYGESATGRYLSDEFEKEPFGWDTDVVRILVACLLRGGHVDMTSSGKPIEGAQSIEARNALGNNNTFRAASFRPKQAMDHAQLILAAENYKNVFGSTLPDISNAANVAADIRRECVAPEESLVRMLSLLLSDALPGADVLQAALDQARSIRTASDEQAILAFNGAFQQLKEAFKRAADLADQLTEPNLVVLRRARAALGDDWAFLQNEPDIPSTLPSQAAELADLLARESFYQCIPRIGQCAAAIRDEHGRRHAVASGKRVAAYKQAIETVSAVRGWSEISPEQQQRLLAPLAACVQPATAAQSITLLRADIDACPSRTQRVIEDMFHLIEGARIVRLPLNRFFSGAIENQEQLDAALTDLREACETQLAEGKKVFLQ